MDDKGNGEPPMSIANYWKGLKSYLNKLNSKDESPLPQKPYSNTPLPPHLTQEYINAEVNALVAKESGIDRVKELFSYEYNRFLF
jgi:hypothetical protein